MTKGKGRCSCPILTVRFMQDMGQVISHRFLCEAQRTGDLAITLPLSNEFEDLCFALREIGRER